MEFPLRLWRERRLWREGRRRRQWGRRQWRLEDLRLGLLVELLLELLLVVLLLLIRTDARLWIIRVFIGIQVFLELAQLCIV